MLIKMFRQSSLELKSLRGICVISFIMAIKILYSYVGIIKLSSWLHFDFGFLALMVVGTMFGPTVSFIFGILADVIGYFLTTPDGAFNIGFTISSVTSAMIYALFLYKFKLGLSRVVIAQVIQNLVVGFCLNTIWLSFMYHNGDFKRTFFRRLPKECVSLFLNCVLVCILAIALKKLVDSFKLD